MRDLDHTLDKLVDLLSTVSSLTSLKEVNKLGLVRESTTGAGKLEGPQEVVGESDNTRKIRLRKPEDFLHIVQSKSLKLIDKAWATLTTKESKPNGRINADCILIRVVDK